jgi:hypothetical protein
MARPIVMLRPFGEHQIVPSAGATFNHRFSGADANPRLFQPPRRTMAPTARGAIASDHHSPSAWAAARLTRLMMARIAATAVRMLSAHLETGRAKGKVVLTMQ